MYTQDSSSAWQTPSDIRHIPRWPFNFDNDDIHAYKDDVLQNYQKFTKQWHSTRILGAADTATQTATEGSNKYSLRNSRSDNYSYDMIFGRPEMAWFLKSYLWLEVLDLSHRHLPHHS
jgi:hypothetical protein